MASLKEIRGRITSVSSTRKITSAMKMVSAAKLKKAQNAIDNSIPYLYKLTTILQDYVASLDGETLSPLTEVREVKKVLIIAVSSNGSLCGAFNNNIIKAQNIIIKAFNETYSEYANKVGKKNTFVCTIGKKISEAVEKQHIKKAIINIDLSSDIDYQSVAAFVEKVMVRFTDKNFDKVIFIYNHIKNAAIQEVRRENLLPFVPPISEKKKSIDYIVEPGKFELVNELIPKVVKLQLYSGLLDSVAAEHGARTTAMQIATDNADELVQTLKLTYNKLRQTAITTEIITITGGAEALRK